MRKHRGGLVMAWCVAAAVAHAQGTPWVAERLDSDTVGSVWAYLDHKDCTGAARVLNEGVKKGYPSVMLMAGAMFEDGVCLKPDWQRALNYYERAHAAGHPRAAAKIAAGYAAPEAGPDKAAALWWALRGRQALPAECKSVATLVDDADRFVNAILGWPVQRLDACAFVAGVVATITGDMRFSQRAAQHGLKGVLTARFVPADSRIDVHTEALEFNQLGGFSSGDEMRDRESKFVKLEFERDIRAAADRALRRYPKPSGIDPAWAVTVEFHFDYVLR